MRLTPLAWTLPVFALGALMMHATPASAQAAAPTTGPTNPPATTPPMTPPSPANNGLPPAATPTPAAPTTSAPPAKTHTRRMSLADRFKAANTSGDGNLTLDQAKAANWSYVTNHFSAIDKTSKGSVTLADIQAFAKARRAARHRATTHTVPSGSGTPSGSATPPSALNPPPMTP